MSIVKGNSIILNRKESEDFLKNMFNPDKESIRKRDEFLEDITISEEKIGDTVSIIADLPNLNISDILSIYDFDNSKDINNYSDLISPIRIHFSNITEDKNKTYFVKEKQNVCNLKRNDLFSDIAIINSVA